MITLNLTCLLILVSLMVLIAYSLKTNKMKMNREKLSTFECGFDPEHKMRNPFSLRFFIITVIFLIFDVEVAIMLPIPLNNGTLPHSSFLISNFYLFAILLSGLIFEWTQGALEWNWKNI